MMNTLQALCGIAAVSGREEALRDYIAAQARPHAQEIRTDAVGNLIVSKRGRKTGPSLMLAAHMDEVGLILRAVTDEGYFKFLPVGAIDRRVLIGKKVLVGPARIPGVIGLKAYHLVSKEEEKTVPKLRDFTIDIGARGRKEAEALAAPGDVAVFPRDIAPFGEGLLRAPALDDRIGCAVMLKLLQTELPLDCSFVFTAQEEVGMRGAFGAAFSLRPDIALVLEGTTAADFAEMEPHRQVCALGQGPVIPFMDAGTVSDRAFFELLRGLAQQHGIPWQTKRYVAGATDAAAIQRSREGVRVAALSAAVRYLHTPQSVASLRDCEALLQLAGLFLEAVANGD